MRRCAQCQVNYPDALEFCPADGSKLPPPPEASPKHQDPLLGSTIDGRYVIESTLGEGGMGVVYAGRHAIIDKAVAIKVLRREYAADEAARQRFLAEAKAASKIGHANIVDITDFGVLPDGHAYFVMEFIRGTTLGRIMHEGGPMPPARAVRIAEQVARGLHAAHQKGITHRDLKPENIFVLQREREEDVVKIVDFGIARDANNTERLTAAGTVLGTPEYMSPEQASGQEIDHRADQYALGCILYEMLTGRVPFLGENPMQTLTYHVFQSVRPPSAVRPDANVPRELELVVLRMLAKKPEQRYPDMDALMRVLEELAPALKDVPAPSPTIAARPPAPETDEIEPVRNTRPALLLAGLGLAAVGGLGLVAARRLVATSPTAQAPQAALPAAPSPAPTPAPTKATDPSPVRAPTAVEAGSIEVVLDSVPPGAEVYCADELVGVTPTKTRQPRAPEGELIFVFRKAGYRPTTQKVLAAKDAYVEVVLPREPSPAPHSAPKHLPVREVPANPPPAAAPAAPPPRRNSELRNPFDDPPK